METLTAVLTALLLLAYLAVGMIALRRPLFARLAFREVMRRRWQSVTIIAALMTAGAAMFAVQVMVDSAGDAIAAGAYKAWGRVDLVASDSGRFFDQQVANRLAADPGVSARVAGVQAGIELVGSVVDIDRGTVRPAVRLIGYDPATQARFGAFQLSGGRHTTEAVLISQSLAGALGAQAGDRLRVVAGDRSIELTAADTAEPVGPGAYGLRPAVYAPISSFAGMVPEGKINVIRIAAPGQGREELDRAHAAAPAVRNALALIPGAAGLSVQELKAADVAQSPRTFEDGRFFFTVLGLMIALAGAALIVNVVLALAEERRPRLAMLRALGLSRAGQVAVGVVEGAIYGLVATVVGLAPGLLLGWVFAQILARNVGRHRDQHDFTMLLTVRPSSVLLAISAGALITLLTVGVATFRSSRMSIALAIKELPEPEARPSRSLRRAGVTGLLALAGFAALPWNAPLRWLGGIAVIIAAVRALESRLPGRGRAVLLGTALSGWSAFNLLGLTGISANYGMLFLLMLSGVAGLSILIAGSLRALEAAAALPRRGRLQAVLRPPLAYLGRRPVRAGLGIAAIALVLTFLVFVSAFRSSATALIRQAGAAYDLEAVGSGSASFEVPGSLAGQVSRQMAIATRSYLGVVTVGNVFNGSTTTQHDQLLRLYALSPQQLADPPLTLNDRETRFHTADDVWRAMADQPGLVITTMDNAGTVYWLDSPQGRVRLEVAARVSAPFLVGLIGSASTMAPLRELPAGTTLLVKTVPGTDVGDFARRLQRALIERGAEVNTTEQMVELTQVGNEGFFALVTLLFKVGLVIGVASLAIMAMRSVVERRRAIGVLRALGYRPHHVLAGMLFEALLAAGSGVLVGVAGGLFVAYAFVKLQNFTALTIDWAELGSTAGVLLAVVVLLTLVPAIQSSRLKPAEAIRQVD